MLHRKLGQDTLVRAKKPFDCPFGSASFDKLRTSRAKGWFRAGFDRGTHISLALSLPVAPVFYLWDNILGGHKNNLTLLRFLHRIPIKILLFEFAEGIRNGVRVV